MQNRPELFSVIILFVLSSGCLSSSLSETEEPVGQMINGQRQGEWKTYYKTGTICLIEHYVNDTLNGPATAFIENGNIYNKAYYKNGTLIDSFIHYFRNGNVNYSEWRDSNGKLQGKTKVYFENGQLKQIANYKDGMMDSTWIEYDIIGREMNRNIIKTKSK